MKFVRFKYKSKMGIGILDEEQIVDLTGFSKSNLEYNFPNSIEQLIETSEKTLPLINHLLESEDVGEYSISISDVDILSPLVKPEKIVCVGLNYLDHCKETGLEVPKSPVIFFKFANAIIGEGDSIEIPINSNQVDYEAEFAIVIGKEGKSIQEEEAYKYIFGYTIMNDVSARDQQFSDGQWSRGKSADTFAPIGPSIVTKNEISDPHNLNISLALNGTVMQDSNTSNLIFNIPYIISYLSQSITLKPGDIIATGTPPGVGMGRKPKVWLKDKDEISITIEGIGTLHNRVKEIELVPNK